jgi:hypothetical protein
MKKAKCKLCNNIIEIKNRVDMFTCPCGEITIDYITTQLHASIKTDKTNLTFVDDDGNEILPKKCFDKVEEVFSPIKINGPKDDLLNEEHIAPSTWFDEGVITDSHLNSRRELLAIIDCMIVHIDRMPQEAKFAPVTNSDFSELLTLIVALFRSS